jgi:peptide chain release factor 3
VVQVFRPRDGSPALVGVVGPLQLDVLKARLEAEYGLEVGWDMAEFTLARWISADDPKVLEKFVTSYRSAIAEDLDGDAVFLARNEFNLEYTGQQSPGVVFRNIKESQARAMAA